MEKQKKLVKKESRKVIGGVKLPPVETVQDDDIKTILDIDPEYYSLVQGRPIRPNISINKYKQDIKNVGLKRTMHGFLIDEIIRIDREMSLERNTYQTAYKHFEECRHSFDKFLAYDNDKTIVIMKRSDNLAKELANQIEEHKNASYELASIKSKLQYIDETLLILLSFENFLHKAAPILWQESQNVKLDTKHSEIVTMDSVIFTKVNVDLIKNRLSKLDPPRLFFQTPQQLMSIFNLIEKQNLNYLLVTEELNCEKNRFLKAKDLLKRMLQKELDRIQRKIEEVEEVINWNIVRETEIKEVFYRILEENIRKSVSSEMALQIFNYVEFAYEQMVAPNDTKQSSYDMALALEIEYDNLMLKLPLYDLNLIKAIEKQTYDKAEKDIKRSKEANKLLKDVDKLSKRLKASFDPSRRKRYD